jgi:redox-sensitive bicupin YhaK (pirin superfamily)
MNSPTPTPTSDGRARVPTLVVDAVHNGPTASSDDNWFILAPDVSRWDPFILLVEDEFSTRGFPWHPHRGFQTLTYVLDGRLEHRDNAGGGGVLGHGDAQYMVAGRYAMHYELAHALKPVRTLQAWINLPAFDKLGPTSYVDLPRAAATRVDQPGVNARLHVGSVAGYAGAAEDQFKVPITLLDAELERSASFIHEVPGDHAVAVHVIEGAVRVAAERTLVEARQTAWFDAEQDGNTSIAIEAEADAYIIAYSGRPVRESVVFGGPFLMNTEQENAQALAEFRAGRFGAIPDDPTATDAATRPRWRTRAHTLPTSVTTRRPTP